MPLKSTFKRNIPAVYIIAIAALGFFCAGNSPAKERAAENKDAYYAEWTGWETRPLDNARKKSDVFYESNFSAAKFPRDWMPDGVSAELKSGAVVLSLAPEAAAVGKKWGVLWLNAPFAPPFMVEVEFTLDPTCPHDANFFWGQKTLSKENLGKEQECYLAGFFGWGGKSCGIERASDWYSYGITGTLDPKPGKKRKGVWIVDGKLQCMYLDGVLVVYSRTLENPPPFAYFGLGIYMSKVTYHSVIIYKPASPKK